MSTIGVGSPDISGLLVQRQRGRSTGHSSMDFPAWVAETAERNEHRLGGLIFAAGVASIVWGSVAIGLAAAIFVL